jgi:hypothetical protein
VQPLVIVLLGLVFAAMAFLGVVIVALYAPFVKANIREARELDRQRDEAQRSS